MATTLEFGIMDGFGDIARYATAAEGYDQHIRDAVLGERLGYRYYFFVEHQNATFNYVSSPSVYLASLARETTSLRFGPMVYQLPMYHPMRLAQDTAVLDNLSHGRLDFGAGFGIQAHEFIRWKLPFGERRAMGEEVMDIVLKAWTQDEVTYDGQYWKFDEALPKPKPYQQPYPPVGGHPQSALAGLCRVSQLPRRPEHRHRQRCCREVRVFQAGVEGARSRWADAAHAAGAARPRGGHGRAGPRRGRA